MQRLPALLPRVGGHHVGEVRPAGLQVVVVAVHAHLDQVVDLLLGEHAQARRDLDVDRRLDRGDALAHLLHQPVVRPAHRGHDAELGRTGRGGLPRRLDQRRDVQPDRAHRRGEQARLRAEVAVLGTAAGLQRDDALDLDLGAAPAHPHVVRELQQRRQVLVGQAQHLEDRRPRRGRHRLRAPGRGPGRGSLTCPYPTRLPAAGRTTEPGDSLPIGSLGHRQAERGMTLAGWLEALERLARHAGQGRAHPASCGRGPADDRGRSGRQRLPRPGRPPRGDRGRGPGPVGVRAGRHRFAPGPRLHRRAPDLEADLADWLGRRAGPGLLLRLPGQPRRASGRSSGPDTLLVSDALQPRLADRRLPLSGARDRGRPARRPGRGRRRCSTPPGPPGGGGHRVGVLGRR